MKYKAVIGQIIGLIEFTITMSEGLLNIRILFMSMYRQILFVDFILSF